MNTKPKFLGFYFPIFLILLPAAITLRTIALISSLDEYGYFSEKLIINIASAIAIGAVIFFITYIFFERKGIKLIPSFDSPASYAPSAIVSVALALLGVYLYSFAFSQEHFIAVSKPLSVVGATLAIASAVYFVASVFIVRRRSMRRADFGIITLVFICVYIAHIYFDTTLPINSPNKTVDLMAYLSVALFFLYETRLSLGREKWRSYIAFGLIAAFLSAYSSIPSLIIYLKDGISISNSIYESLLSLTLSIFATSKILLTTTLVEDVENPVVTKIIAAHNARKAELAPDIAEPEIEEISESEDENQLSITDITMSSEDINAEPDASSSPDVNEDDSTPNNTDNTEENLTFFDTSDFELEKADESAESLAPEEENASDSLEVSEQKTAISFEEGEFVEETEPQSKENDQISTDINEEPDKEVSEEAPEDKEKLPE